MPGTPTNNSLRLLAPLAFMKSLSMTVLAPEVSCGCWGSLEAAKTCGISRRYSCSENRPLATCACSEPMYKAAHKANKLPRGDLREVGEMGCFILRCYFGGAGKWRIYRSLACFGTPLIDPVFLTLSFHESIWRTDAFGQPCIN